MAHDGRTYPVATQHHPRGVHPNGRNQAGLSTEEPMVKECDLHQELGQCPSLNVVLVRFGDFAAP